MGDARDPAGPGPAREDEAAPLTARETAALSALVEGLFPRDDLGPGAADIGVVDYLARAFLGPYRDWVPAYRRVLAALDAAAERDHGRRFASLAPEPRDAIIGRLERARLDGLRHPDDERFFTALCQHLREGLFGDPIHGGNRGMLGWRLIGFPGAQFGYTEAEQELDAPIGREPRSVSDLHADRRGR